MDLTLKDDASKTFAVVLKDKFGAVTAATGALAVASSDETIVTAALSSDSQSVTVSPAGAGKLGAATVTVSDEADNVSAVVNVTVVAGAPVSIELDDTSATTDASASTATDTAAASTTAAATDSSAAASTDAAAASDASTTGASTASDASNAAAASTDASAADATAATTDTAASA